MATSSIFTNIVIDTPEAAERFVEALERAEQFPSRDYSKTAIPLSQESPDDFRKKINVWLERHKQ